ncbi:MAG: bifunctional phosphopantothenoylcysteine decarboxylase/phosphopantothenate--cysteine ligase CoaBC [Actinomycetia bacterium]|nr:bifunctional phosphopantothenoylcysteine decarboxylase/phosphopantothenate--cysteine ligase CoaBC [Actinomycetes bacterium]
MPRIVLGVAGGIAAYKACDLLRLLTEAGHHVRVVPTAAALQFVGAPTWAALSGQPVTADLMADVHEVPHVRIGQQAELVVIAPTTANLLAKAAHGLADDLLTNVLLTARCPVIMVPAMHTEMWEHPATVQNVATLRGRGVLVVEPAVGRLTGADSGKGRMPEPSQILEIVEQVVARRPVDTWGSFDLRGRHVVVSAGGTREPLDPVRFLGNRSSGRQGYALAAAAAARGAVVDLVAANVDLPDPAGVIVTVVETAAQLKDAVLARSVGADAVVMAAAVADFRPSGSADHKLKKGDGAPTVVLEPTDDVLSALVAAKPDHQVVVGFAAETGDSRVGWLEHGREKLERKGADLLVVNEVGDGLAFGTDDNAAVVLSRDGSETEIPRGPKRELAHVVWGIVRDQWLADGWVHPAHPESGQAEHH